ncbi:DUF1176 domain-containing protein [Pseudoduganella violacea]|uniref:Invasion protein IalB n=1 Tax=Pseudoduganella violacea TaxID=1715466 RepID=A0A7W5BF52_9BURK|nr:DUF1176 domain-containing protein [Pseudoduganella violacea]MBB3121993.1 invasion protein IalB [Pseudoduganella violacea]
MPRFAPLSGAPGRLLLAAIGCLLMAGHAAAAPAAGFSFSHHDWEIACDNTRTCRAAGYQPYDREANALSVLLTRKAGPQQPVRARLQLGDATDEPAIAQLRPDAKLQLRIDGKPQGMLALGQDGVSAEIPAPQLAALLNALKGDGRIVWSSGEFEWELSGKGAAAVLLKMDEFQGRLGTPGALMRKGGKSEAQVLPALAVPVLKVPFMAQQQAVTVELSAAQQATLIGELRKPEWKEDCEMEEELGSSGRPLRIVRLSESRLLVSAQCWLAAYNFGEGYWVINTKAPFNPVLVTTSGNEYMGGVISASHRGRGLGDCWSREDWAWDGQQFHATGKLTTGMCRMISLGGPWELPTLVTEVRHRPK